MKKVLLTGGIGCGKSTVSRIFNCFGVPCYCADNEAYKLLSSNRALQKKMVHLLGEETYKDGSYNKPYVSQRVFEDRAVRMGVSQLMTEYVWDDFMLWCTEQNVPLVLAESASVQSIPTIFDHCIAVLASLELRIERVMQRNQLSQKEVQQRIESQVTEETYKEWGDYLIYNDENMILSTQVESVYKGLINAIDEI